MLARQGSSVCTQLIGHTSRADRMCTRTSRLQDTVPHFYCNRRYHFSGVQVHHAQRRNAFGQMSNCPTSFGRMHF